jgi:arginyl-tRNA synthetase
MLLAPLTEKLTPLITALGLPESSARVTMADRPDLADVQCNGALQGAKALGQPPRTIAEKIVAAIKDDIELSAAFGEITIAGPGFINFKIAPDFLAKQLMVQSKDEKFGLPDLKKPETIVFDFCGPNAAKMMHVGHIRTTIIGDAIQRLYKYLGYKTISDVHLGDWGLPMGMLINEIQMLQPDLPYFKDDFSGPFPKESPVTFEELCALYPQGANRAKADLDERKKIGVITAKMQQGHPGYRALRQHFIDLTFKDVREKTDALDVHFDLWLGESDTEADVPPMLEDLKKRGLAVEDDGALVMFIAKDDDKYTVPPIMLVKSDGGVIYGTTDVATIVQRQRDFKPDRIVYVVDQRQALHFEQVFRAARKAGYIGDHQQLIHVGYGTMNGSDGKPFKTRDGGVLSLDAFLEMVQTKALDRAKEINLQDKLSPEEFAATTKMIGYAAAKFADLMNNPKSDYNFDLDKFVSFEGKTGPYIQYTVVRTKALLAKAKEQGFAAGHVVIDEAQHEVALLLLQFPQTVVEAADQYAPNLLADYLFRLAQSVNRFYQNVHVLSEEDTEKRGAALGLLDLSTRILTQGLALLGIMIPNKM